MYKLNKKLRFEIPIVIFVQSTHFFSRFDRLFWTERPLFHESLIHCHKII